MRRRLAVARQAPAKEGVMPVQRRVPDDGIVRIMRERRRAGTMSVVTGLDPGEIDEVAKLLKRHCGTGGTSKNGVVEIQGDHRERIAAWFAARQRKVKLAGG
jgi:translation initiation factor 1